MKKLNKKAVSIKRSKIQQTVISLCCIILMLGSFSWIIHTAVSTKGILLTADTTDMSVEKKEKAKDNNDKQNVNKADSSSGNAENNDSSSKQESASSIDENKADESSEDKSEFADAVFIGNSLTVGLMMNTDIPKATFLASTGLNVTSAVTDKVATLSNGKKGTILDALKEKQFNRIYIMFGINEMGWPYPKVFEEKYESLINEIKKLQPDAKIYVQSILPVNYKATNTNKIFTNDNVNKFNKYVENVAKKTNSKYLDVGSVFKDSTGALPVDASTDGIHLVHSYCQKWLDYLIKNS